MKLIGIEKKTSGGSVRLAGRVLRGGGRGELEVFFEYPERFASLVAQSADPFVPALLLPAMADREELEIGPPVSARLWNTLPLIQEILGSWFPEVLSKVPIRAGGLLDRSPERKDATGAFFSLGVDSFHTLLRHEGGGEGTQRITHLVHMTGFEAPLREHADGREGPVVDSVLEVARHWRKEAICGRTNLRDCFPLEWGAHYHGAGLAAAALSLSGGMGKFLIPSSHSWRYIHGWGSSPITDPLWSSDAMEIIHDGTCDDRAWKIAGTIIHHPEALRRLRVCLATRGGAGNCGLCGKCIRTMVTLEIAGSLESCGVFPPRLPRDFWRRLRLKKENDLIFADENLRFAREKKAPAWIIAGLERAIAQGRLDLMLRARGKVRFFKDLIRLALRRTIGRLILYPDRKRRRRFKPGAGE